jgi:hypothetical protein
MMPVPPFLEPAMRTHRRLVSLFASVALAACTMGSAPQRESMTAPGTDLAAYRSFGWKPEVAEGTVQAPLRIVDVQVRDAVRAELTGRGYVEDAASPQLLLTWETAAVEKAKSNPLRIGVGLGGFSGNMGGSVNVGSPGTRNVREGMLVIHAIDAATNREVWYGSVSGELDRTPVDAAAVARGVGIALEDFPKRATTAPAAPPAPAAP